MEVEKFSLRKASHKVAGDDPAPGRAMDPDRYGGQFCKASTGSSIVVCLSISRKTSSMVPAR